MLLAGDVGGTKTRLGLYEPAAPRPRLISAREFPTAEFSGLAAIVRAFLADQGASGHVTAAALGVAGPVRDEAVELTNVPWRVSASDIRALIGHDAVALLNDVEAMAYSVEALDASECVCLQTGDRDRFGNAALVSVGTGLGMATLHRVGGEFVPLPSECGHADFAARTERELELVAALRRQHGRVEIEQIISGPGLATLARFTHNGRCPNMSAQIASADEPAAVSRAALDGSCWHCREAMEMFVAALGALGGNVALMTKATGGLFIGGGVPPKVLPALRWPALLASFCDKAPLETLMRSIPVTVVTFEGAGLLGAAIRASRLPGHSSTVV